MKNYSGKQKFSDSDDDTESLSIGFEKNRVHGDEKDEDWNEDELDDDDDLFEDDDENDLGEELSEDDPEDISRRGKTNNFWRL